jgi:hypothetical protein
MVQIAKRESGLQCAPPRNGNGRGLFQLAGHQELAAQLGFTWEQVSTNCGANIAVAWALYAACGTGPWTPPNWPCTPGR